MNNVRLYLFLFTRTTRKKEAEISLRDKKNNISKPAIGFTYTINNNSIVSMPYSIYSSFEEDWGREDFKIA